MKTKEKRAKVSENTLVSKFDDLADRRSAAEYFRETEYADSDNSEKVKTKKTKKRFVSSDSKRTIDIVLPDDVSSSGDKNNKRKRLKKKRKRVEKPKEADEEDNNTEVPKTKKFKMSNGFESPEMNVHKRARLSSDASSAISISELKAIISNVAEVISSSAQSAKKNKKKKMKKNLTFAQSLENVDNFSLHNGDEEDYVFADDRLEDDEDNGEDLGSEDTADDGPEDIDDEDDSSFIVSDDELYGDDDDDEEYEDEFEEENSGEDGEEMEVNKVDELDSPKVHNEKAEENGVDNNENSEPESLCSNSSRSVPPPVNNVVDYGALKAENFKVYINDEQCVALRAYRNQKRNCGEMLFQLYCFTDDFASDAVSESYGLQALQWIVKPFCPSEFLNSIHQQRAFVINRALPRYHGNFYSIKDFLQTLSDNNLEYGTNVNVACYKDGVRTTLNGKGRVSSAHFREHLSNGASVQCVNPQSYNKSVQYLCELLQEIFGSFVGANNYLTPPNSEGFAPHWDDVDAFIMQLEGRKYWKILAPANNSVKLPLVSSENFNEEIFNSEDYRLVFDGYLDAGDLLYIPRGFIHKGKTRSRHSHHITISVCQRFTLSEFLDKTLLKLVERESAQDFQLRSNIPPYFFYSDGVADITYHYHYVSKQVKSASKKFFNKMSQLFDITFSSLTDSMFMEFMRVALPPVLSHVERKYSSEGICESKIFENWENDFRFDECAKYRFIRRLGQRLIFTDSDSAFIVHRMANPLVYNDKREPTTFDFPLELECGYNALCQAYPNWITIDKLALSKKRAKQLVKLLFMNGILLINTKEVTKKKRIAIKD